MSLWKNREQSNGAPIYAPAQKNQAPTAVNANNMYEANSTANLSIVGITDVDMAANRKLPHTGWVLKTTGTGGRANRIQYECLVAGGLQYGVGAVTLTIAVDTADKSVNTDISTTFSVGVTADPTVDLVYQWQRSINSTAAFANLSNAGVYSNVTTATLTIANTNGLNGNRFRCVVDSANADLAAAVTSTNATLTVS